MDLAFRPKHEWFSHVLSPISPAPPIRSSAATPPSNNIAPNGHAVPAQLLGCGFNAHGQVTGQQQHLSAPTDSDEANMSTALTSLFARHAHVKVRLAKWAYTVVQADNTPHLLGLSSSDSINRHEMHVFASESSALDLSGFRFFGTDMQLLGAIAEDGRLFDCFVSDFPHANAHVLAECYLREELHGWNVGHVAVLYSGGVAVLLAGKDGMEYRILSFGSVTDFHSVMRAAPGGVSPLNLSRLIDGGYRGEGQVLDLVAGSSAYAMLTASGEVFTWGSKNHPELLGRTADADTPADQPHRVEYLAGLVATKIAGEGGMFGALTRDKDVYLWGTTTSWRDAVLRSRDEGEYEFRLKDVVATRELVGLVDVEEDVVDFGIGLRHIVIVTDKGLVRAVGDNRHQQCGITSSLLGFVSWADVPVKAAAVVCGPLTTFLHQ